MSIFSNPFGKKKQPVVKKAVATPSVTKKALKKPVVKKTVSRGGKSRGK
jgi:hypothetical protein